VRERPPDTFRAADPIEIEFVLREAEPFEADAELTEPLSDLQSHLKSLQGGIATKLEEAAGKDDAAEIIAAIAEAAPFKVDKAVAEKVAAAQKALRALQDKARTKLRAALSLTVPTEIEDILNEVAIHEDVLSADIRALKKNCDGLVKAASAEMDKLAAGADSPGR
jgi:hypothetical protein